MEEEKKKINELEENLKKAKEIKETLSFTIDGISEYHRLPQEVKKEKAEEYKMLLDTRDNLNIKLNYFQNKIKIEQFNEMIEKQDKIIQYLSDEKFRRYSKEHKK